MQAAGGDGIQPPHLADDAGEAAMAQPLLHGEQHGARCLDEQHTIEVEADMGQGGREEIGAFRSPQHRAFEPREDAGDHEPGGGRVFQRRAGIGEFMQASEAQATFRQMTVDGVYAERQYGAEWQRAAALATVGSFRGASPFQRGECLA